MMTSDVLITIKGLQMALDNSDSLEIITNGKYFKKNGKHYVLYEEVVEDQRVSNMIKIYNETVEVTKKGLASVQMFFETGKKNTSIYSTPFGQIEISIYAEQIRVNETDRTLELNMQYDLELNSQHVSDSQVSVTVVSR